MSPNDLSSLIRGDTISSPDHGQLNNDEVEIMEELIDLREEKKGDVLIVRIKGRLDAISTGNAEKKVFDLINHGQNKLLFDLTQVDYLSSAGMRMLLSTTKKLKTLSGKLVICSVNTNVMDVLKMSGFDHVLDLSKNIEDGLQKFQVHA